MHGSMDGLLSEQDGDSSAPQTTLIDVVRNTGSSADAPFAPHTWADCTTLVRTNRLELFERRPSDMLKYQAWTKEIRQRFPNITDYILTEKLHWTPVQPVTTSSPPIFEPESLVPFEIPSDYKILRNDWPYGFENDIASPGMAEDAVRI